MENFFIDDYFCSDLSDLLSHLDMEDEDVEVLPEDWSIKCEQGYLEPVVKLTMDWLIERIGEERFPEEHNDSTYKKTIKALGLIPFDMINATMPKIYYGGHKTFTVTKNDLLEYIK